MEVEKVKEVQPLPPPLSSRHGVSSASPVPASPSHLSGLVWSRASASESSPELHHDLGERSGEDVSARNLFITPTSKGRLRFLSGCGGGSTCPLHVLPAGFALRSHFISWKYWCVSRFSLWRVQLLLLRRTEPFALKLLCAFSGRSPSFRGILKPPTTVVEKLV